MTVNMIHDRGRGPEIVGTRITVYNLLPYFLDASATEEFICRVYELTAAQVAAARAYVLNHPDEVLAEHLKIEARIAVGNPPEVIEAAKRTHVRFLKFREWLAQRERQADAEHAATRPSQRDETGLAGIPTFEQWLVER